MPTPDSQHLPLLALLTLFGWVCCSTPAAPPARPAGRDVAVGAVPVPLNADDPTVHEVGRLRYRAGFHLTSADEDFGGFSGLVVRPDGRLLAVSDRGHWLEAELRFAADGTLEGISSARMGPLPDEDGRPVDGRERRDAEELHELPGRGYLVSFEGDHRLELYPATGGGRPSLADRPEPFPCPPEIRGVHHNKGMEAVALLEGGKVLAFAEEAREGTDEIPGWIGDPRGRTWELLALTSSDGFQATGAAALPSGDVLLLERRYYEESGVTRVRLTRIASSSIVPGARLEPVELGRLEPPLTVDNMEAVAVGSGPGDEVFVYLMSDDNLSEDQRTLLLQFELDSP